MYVYYVKIDRAIYIIILTIQNLECLKRHWDQGDSMCGH